MVTIRGKRYAEVKDRIKLFRAQFPDWSITTELIAKAEDMSWVLFQSIIISPDEKQVFTGWAFERESSDKDDVNFTSHVENCETSAVGRALANMDFAGSENRPSAEEMQKVDRSQKQKLASSEPVEAPVNPLAAKLKTKPAGGVVAETEAILRTMKALIGHDQAFVQAMANRHVTAPSELSPADWKEAKESMLSWLNQMADWLFKETKITSATHKDLSTDDQRKAFAEWATKTSLLI